MENESEQAVIPNKGEVLSGPEAKRLMGQATGPLREVVTKLVEHHTQHARPMATQSTPVTSLEVRRRHESHLRQLGLMAHVINEVKQFAVAGVLKLTKGGACTPAQDSYLMSCTRRVPDLGVLVILTRDVSQQLKDALHLGFYLHLGLQPIPASRLVEFKEKNPAFVQLAELDDSSALDWVTTAFAPYQQQAWEERLQDGTRNFRLFCKSDFSAPKTLWTNQSRGLRNVLHWRMPFAGPKGAA